jgi:hypothetical protein
MAANASAIRAGQAFVELFADDTKLRKGLEAARRKLDAWGASLAATGAKIAAAGLALDAAGDRTVLAWAQAGNELSLMSARTGVAVEELSALTAAAEMSGVGAEALEHGLRPLQREIAAAATGSAEANRRFTRLGLNARQLAGQGGAEQLGAFASALLRLPEGAQRSAAAMGVLGRQGTALLPLLKDGADGLDAMKRKAEQAGLVWSTEDAEAARQFTATVRLLELSLKQLTYRVGSALAPAFLALREYAQPVVEEAIAWTRANSGLLVSLSKIGLAVAGVGAGMIGLGFILRGVFPTVGLLTTAVKLLFAVLSSPAGIAVGLTVAAAYLLYTRGLVGNLGESFKDFKDDAVEAWDGVVDAISSGDVKLAGEIALNGLESAWVKAINRLKIGWSGLKFFFITSLSEMVLSSDFLTKAVMSIGSAIDKLLNKVGLVSDEDLAKRLKGAEVIAGMGAAQRKKLAQQIHDKELADLMHEQAGMAVEEGGLREQLKALRNRARQERKPPRLPGHLKAPSLDLLLTGKGGTAGTFSASAAGRLGAGSLAERTAEAVERSRDLLEDINRKMEEGWP